VLREGSRWSNLDTSSFAQPRMSGAVAINIASMLGMEVVGNGRNAPLPPEGRSIILQIVKRSLRDQKAQWRS
jgi:hypothetical protein